MGDTIDELDGVLDEAEAACSCATARNGRPRFALTAEVLRGQVAAALEAWDRDGDGTAADRIDVVMAVVEVALEMAGTALTAEVARADRAEANLADAEAAIRDYLVPAGHEEPTS